MRTFRISKRFGRAVSLAYDLVSVFSSSFSVFFFFFVSPACYFFSTSVRELCHELSDIGLSEWRKFVRATAPHVRLNLDNPLSRVIIRHWGLGGKRMGLFTGLRQSIARVTDKLFTSEEPKRIGIYGPPNAGKTTLANRIARDWTGDAVGPESHVPHETRRARRKENVEIERDGRKVTIDIVDTPGVTTKVDYEEFLDHDMDKEDAVRRSREATEGVAEAMHWLREDVDGVIYVLDSSTDPFTQVNTMLIGIIESQDLPVLILANKTDLDDSSVQRIRNAYPQHETIPLSALEGDNMDEVYTKIAEYFG